ncbi:MAG: hypothetical protein ACOC5K_05020 [Chloroflexota bacterium]
MADDKGRRFDPAQSFPSAAWLDGTPVVSEFVEEVEVVSDLTPAEWIAPRLLPRGRGHVIRVGSYIPTGYEAYARVFNPGRRKRGGGPVSWTEVARMTGRVAHPRMLWETITYPAEGHPPVASVGRPLDGLREAGLAATLVETLRRHTSKPEQSWMAVWEGWADLPEADVPLIEHPDRRYVLLRGEIDAAARPLWRDSRRGPLDYIGPSLWWPEDHAWCVATEIDDLWTYVGGSRDCVDQLLGDERLEAFEVESSDTLFDNINPLPPELRKRMGLSDDS